MSGGDQRMTVEDETVPVAPTGAVWSRESAAPLVRA